MVLKGLEDVFTSIITYSEAGLGKMEIPELKSKVVIPVAIELTTHVRVSPCNESVSSYTYNFNVPDPGTVLGFTIKPKNTSIPGSIYGNVPF